MKGKVNFKKIFFSIVFISLIILGRIIFLSADLPTSFNLLDLYPMDEGFYTQSAFNLYNYGTFTHNVVPYITGDAGVANLFQTILTYISLLIFGNNYYGVRMPSVFISLVTIWLFYLTLQNIKEDNSKFTNYSIFFMVLYFVTDFEYLSISRIYVPTIFRIFFITLMIYIFSRYYKKSYKETFTYKNIFLFSFLSMSSIFFIYIYNIFIYSATVFTIFIISVINNWKDNKKQIFKDSLFMILGSIVSLLLFILYLRFFINISIYDYILSLINTQQTTRMTILQDSNIFYKILVVFYQIFSTNIFRFNISLLFIFILLLPSFFLKVIRKKIVIETFLISLLLFLLLQSIVENTYYHKRLTILLPIILIILFLEINYFKNKLEVFKKKYYLHSIIFIIYLLISIIIPIIVLYKNNIVGGDNLGALNAKGNELFTGNLTIEMILISLFNYLFIIILVHILIIKNEVKTFIIILFFLIIPNLLLIFSYTYNYQQNYHFKNTMIELSKFIDNKIIPGQASFSLRFYNKSIPVLNWYKYYSTRRNEYVKKFSKIILSSRSKYFLQLYSDKNPPFHFVNRKNSPVIFSPKEVFYIGNGFLLVLYEVHKNEEISK